VPSAVFSTAAYAHFREHNIDPETIVEARLAPDMLPLRFQIISVAQHSREVERRLEGRRIEHALLLRPRIAPRECCATEMIWKRSRQHVRRQPRSTIVFRIDVVLAEMREARSRKPLTAPRFAVVRHAGVVERKSYDRIPPARLACS